MDTKKGPDLAPSLGAAHTAALHRTTLDFLAGFYNAFFTAPFHPAPVASPQHARSHALATCAPPRRAYFDRPASAIAFTLATSSQQWDEVRPASAIAFSFVCVSPARRRSVRPAPRIASVLDFPPLASVNEPALPARSDQVSDRLCFRRVLSSEKPPTPRLRLPGGSSSSNTKSVRTPGAVFQLPHKCTRRRQNPSLKRLAVRLRRGKIASAGSSLH